MIQIRYAQQEDWLFWRSLDAHLPEKEFGNKVRLQQGYVLLMDGQPVGLLRYSLFWDEIPFCNMLILEETHRKMGFGRKLMSHWEADMRERGYQVVLTSTQVDEQAQHFYRKLGYRDCGGLLLDVEPYQQPMELFLVKKI